MRYETRTELTVFDADAEETEIFLTLAPRYGVVPGFISSAARCSGTSYGRCISIGHKTAMPAETLRQLACSGVQYISTRSIGYDHIDTAAAASLGITVQNTPYAPDGIAEYTLMLLLMAVRRIGAVLSHQKQYDFRLGPMRGKELRTLTVGVIGAGRIGQAVINRLNGFGCRILVHDPLKDAGGETLHSLLESSDIVTLHVPLSEDTWHMMNAAAITHMKQGAVLINTARGALVDTDALLTALECGKLGGAALDVLEGEESIFYTENADACQRHPFLSRLLKLPQVIITPHMAYHTDHILYDTVEKTLENCLNFERGKTYGA